MDLSPQQDAAIRAVEKWLTDPSKQVFRLFGYAGTGKTTIAKMIAQAVDGEVLYGAYTGKAALVLQKKGCYGAMTIHSMIYKPNVDPHTGKVDFVLNHDSDVGFCDLIIIDEVSMVDSKLGDDLLSFGVKVLVLGDPAQLPPVKGQGFFIEGTPDVMLTEVHRQARDNPIIRMSMDVREGRGLSFGTYGSSRVLDRSQVDRAELREIVLASDQLLCGRNQTRQSLNAQMRRVKDMSGSPDDRFPIEGDRLVCLKNNRDFGLLNGGLWDVQRSEFQLGPKGKWGHMRLRVKSVDEPHRSPVDVCVPEAFFFGTEKDLHWRDLIGYQEFTYGYALTVHKSQGSQWDNVTVYDEAFVFREDADKHLYTAITRAADRVTVLR